MKKESTDQVICYEESRSSVFLKYFIICMLIHAILLSFHIGHEMVDHFTIEHAKYDDEIYHPHCQSISLILSALMLWYFLIIVLIVTTRYDSEVLFLVYLIKYQKKGILNQDGHYQS